MNANVNKDHVLVLPCDATGCGTYRLIWPGMAVKKAGKPVTIAQRSAQIYVHPATGQIMGVNVGSAGVVVFQRPGSHQIAQIIPLLQKEGRRVIIDLDDSLSTIHPRNPAFKSYDPRVNHKSNWMHAAKACELADMVTVTTEGLAEEYGAHGRVKIIPNHIPESYLNIPRTENAVPVTGWAGYTATHVDDLRVTRGMINQALVDTGGKFAAFGDKYIFTELGIKLRAPHEHWSFTNINEYPKRLAGLDIGLVPLQDSKFNSCKCLDEQTLIATKKGICPLTDIIAGDFTWHNGEWVEVLSTHREPARPGLLLTTYDGYQLKLSPEHRLLVNGEWITADEIQIGDLVSTEPDSTAVSEYVRVPWPADSRMTKGDRHKNQNLTDFTNATDGPTVLITPRWGRILGAFAGDGGLTGKTALTISCDGIDPDWIDTLTNDFEMVGLSVGTEQKKMYNGTLLRRRSIRVSSSHLLRFLDVLGVIEHREGKNPIRKVCVPEVIWHSPIDVIAAFLSGYFEADGSCAGSSVNAVSKSEKLIRDIQRLLLLFGIESRVKDRYNKCQNGTGGIYWQINLRRAGADLFQEKIGFGSIRKQERLAQITSKPHSNSYQPLVWTQEIVDIDRCFITPIDIQVKGEVFAAAGFVSHNSFLKGLEYASLGIVPVVSPVRDYKNLIDMGMALPASTPKEWYTVVKELILDNEMRQELSVKVRKLASVWTIEKNWLKWHQAWTDSDQAAVV